MKMMSFLEQMYSKWSGDEVKLSEDNSEGDLKWDPLILWVCPSMELFDVMRQQASRLLDVN